MNSTIMIRNLDRATAKWIDQEAEQRRMSIEMLVIQLLHEGIKSSQSQAYHDLDSLAGTWGDEEATEFLNAIADFDRVDEQLWQ